MSSFVPKPATSRTISKTTTFTIGDAGLFHPHLGQDEAELDTGPLHSGQVRSAIRRT